MVNAPNTNTSCQEHFFTYLSQGLDVNKKIINTLLLSACSLNVIAAPLLPHTVKDSTKQTTGTEVNFSGVWKADNCGSGHSWTITIVQNNQDYIQIGGGEVSVIGTLETAMRSSNSPFYKNPEGEISSIDWNKAKTELTLRGISVTKPTDDSATGNADDNSLHIMIQINTLSLNKEGQLQFKAKGIKYQDLQSIDEWDAPICVFNKIADIPGPFDEIRSLTALRK